MEEPQTLEIAVGSLSLASERTYTEAVNDPRTREPAIALRPEAHLPEKDEENPAESYQTIANVRGAYGSWFSVETHMSLGRSSPGARQRRRNSLGFFRKPSKQLPLPPPMLVEAAGNEKSAPPPYNPTKEIAVGSENVEIPSTTSHPRTIKSVSRNEPFGFRIRPRL
jgi:hypothetical protein